MNETEEKYEHDMPDTYFKELLVHQLKNVPMQKKLQYNDIKRVSKYVSSSIFDENNCCIWTGYITNSKNKNKGTYINFYFKKKKIALHRLLYINFVGKLQNDEYLKFSCNNKGKCCNIHHMKKFKYNKTDKLNDDDEITPIIKKNKCVHIFNGNFIISFD